MASAIAQTDYKALIDKALEQIALTPEKGSVVVDLKMRDADVSDRWPLWIVLMIFVGFGLTWGLQSVAQTFHIDILQKTADFLWEGGMLTGSIWQGQLWRGITSAFLHGGWFHIISNCLAFLMAAFMVNACFKRRGWMIIFFGTQFLGSLATTAINPETQAVGASIGLMGLFGAMVSAQIRYRWVKPDGKPAAYLMSLQSLLIQLALQLGLEHLIPNVGHVAHATGLAAGLLLGFLLPINAGMALYATRKDIATVRSAKKHQRSSSREFVESIEVQILPDFDKTRDAIYELKMSRNWRNKVSYVTTLIAGSAAAITNRDFVRLANRYKVVDRDFAKAAAAATKNATVAKNTDSVPLPWVIRIPLFAAAIYAWYYVYGAWFSDIVLPEASLQWLNFLPASVAPYAINLVAHGGGILMSGIIVQILHGIVGSFVLGAIRGKSKKSAESET